MRLYWVWQADAIQNDRAPANKNEQGGQQGQSPIKKEVFIKWEQPQVLLVYFKQIEKARKQLRKVNIKMLDDDIVIHVVDQMYDSDWFSAETMMAWE